MPAATTSTTKAAAAASAAPSKVHDGLKIFEGFLSKRSKLTEKTPNKASSTAAHKAPGTAVAKAPVSAAHHKVTNKHSNLSFSRFSTKVRLLILQHLVTEKDILTYLQIEGACRDVLYIYPEAVFGRFRSIDHVPWIRAFPSKPDSYIRRSWHSRTGRWALVQLEGRKHMVKRSDALLLDLKTKALVKSRVVPPLPLSMASTSADELRDWCEITSAAFTSNEKYVVTSSRRLTCVCECAKSAIIASLEHASAPVEASIVTNDGRYLILVSSAQIQIFNLANMSQAAASIRHQRTTDARPRRWRYLPASDALLVSTMGTSLECWDLSKRSSKPVLFYRLTGPLIDPEVMLQSPDDPSGRKILLAKKDGTGNAVLTDLRATDVAANSNSKRTVRQWPIVHGDLKYSKQWIFSADGRWLLVVSASCCQHVLRMWDLRADFAAPSEVAPVEVDPMTLFKTKEPGGLQFRGTTGTHVIIASYTAKSDVADKIFVLDTKTKAVKTILNSGKHVTRGCPGTWTISAEGGCMATTCDASDEVWAWLVPNASNTVPPQSKLNNHRMNQLHRDELNQAGRDLYNQASKMQRTSISSLAAVNEYFIITDRSSVLFPREPSSFFVKQLKERVARMRSTDPTFTTRLTRKVVDHLWSTMRLLLLRKFDAYLDLNSLDIKDMARLSSGLTTVNGVPSALFNAAHEIITLDLLYRNPFEFRKQFVAHTKQHGLLAKGESKKASTATAVAEKKRAIPKADGGPAENENNVVNLLGSSEAITESLWLHRPSLHLLGKTAVVELVMEDYTATEKHTPFFSDDGNWVLGGSRIYNVSEAYGYLSAKETVESDCIDAVDRLTDIIDRLSCPCQNCADISNSLAALMNSAPPA